ncbi:hypothetical protein [Sorangium sp. So ce363]|uniref:hypothetical protein n=1 Tax=Sorangium sp. So ce363 TaxID=3133304 RepID=UPI003F5F0D64
MIQLASAAGIVPGISLFGLLEGRTSRYMPAALLMLAALQLMAALSFAAYGPLVGVVWCYVFVTATTLVARSRPGSERFRAQGVARRLRGAVCSAEIRLGSVREQRSAWSPRRESRQVQKIRFARCSSSSRAPSSEATWTRYATCSYVTMP